MLIAIRKDMLRFARLQLRGADAAEDVVQEAIEAALRHSSGFSGQSTLKTWVFAILKNKIVDHLRGNERTVSISSLMQDGEDWEQQLESLFDERGHWRAQARPAAWPSPEQALVSRQFWGVFETCLQCLPQNVARVFMMRELLGLESSEICGRLGLTTTNLHVILHRARLKLRGCMEQGWGRPGEGAC